MRISRGWVVAVCLIFFQPCFSQIKSGVLFEIPSGDRIPGVSMTLNPRNPAALAAAIGNRTFASINGGETWSEINIPSADLQSSSSLVTDSKGIFYLIHTATASSEGDASEKKSEALMCRISADGGKSWDNGTVFASAPGEVVLNPSAAVDSKGNVWVVWTQFDRTSTSDTTCRSTIMVANSSNGKKWSEPMSIAQVKGTCSSDDRSLAGAAIGISDDKKVFVSWASQQIIFLDRSFDHGGRWLTNDILVANQSGGWVAEIPGFTSAHGMPAMIVDRSKTEHKGLLYLVWADNRNGNSDVFFSRSNNFGDIWNPAMNLNESEKLHQFMPVMSVDNVTGAVYVLYYGQSGKENEIDTYLAYSMNAGTSFKTVKVSDASFNPAGVSFNSRQLDVVAHNGRIITLWTSVEDGKILVRHAQFKEDALPK